MRVSPAGRWLAWAGCLFASVFAAGCQSTTSLPKSLSRESYGGVGASSPQINWKKASAAPSAALAQDQWTDPPKVDEPVRTTNFQEEKKDKPKSDKIDWMPPPPELMNGEPRPVVVGPAPLAGGHKLGHKHHHGKAPLPLPNAPSEMSPVALPAYVLRPADVLTIELLPRFTREKEALKSEKIGLNQPIYGPHPVHPDGTISLGIYGTLLISGKTVAQAREEIARKIFARLNPDSVSLKDVLDNLRVDIANYNNGFYYVIVNYAGTAGIGEVVERFPVAGTETVLDAISKTKSYGQPNLPGLPGMTSPGRIWVARSNAGHIGPDTILPVDWKAITQLGVMTTNWQIMPGDRLYLQAEPIRRFDNTLAKYLLPMQRLLGVAQQVNVLRNNNSTNLVAPPLP
jgi:polysaccharide export outer membrane protein